MTAHRLTAVSALVAALLLSTASGDDPKPTEPYKSPYSVKFTHPVKELVGDLEGPRGDPRQQSEIPYREWNSEACRKQCGSWGPPQRHYPEPEGIASKPRDWKQQRVVAIALHFEGYGYQHHHVPDWSPAQGWPWQKTAVGHNGKGVDCSNFTAFVYNLGFGIKPNSAVAKQAEERAFALPGEKRQHNVELIRKPATYKELVATLQTGDLLYVRNNKGDLAHVVIWVGPIGHSPDGAPLIIDSHGEGVKDSDGNSIPCGIHLRPFHEKSWYYHSASHALRVFHEK